MRYLLNSDRSIKGRIIEMMKMVAGETGEENASLVQKLCQSFDIYKQEWMDEKSLYVRAHRNKKIEGKPLPIKKADEEIFKDSMVHLENEAKKVFTHQRVMAFVDEQLKGHPSITSGEMDIMDDQNFIFLMLSALKGGNKDVFYEVTLTEEYISKLSYLFPQICFVRKERKNVDTGV